MSQEEYERHVADLAEKVRSVLGEEVSAEAVRLILTTPSASIHDTWLVDHLRHLTEEEPERYQEYLRTDAMDRCSRLLMAMLREGYVPVDCPTFEASDSMAGMIGRGTLYTVSFGVRPAHSTTLLEALPQ